ncbi:MAG: polyphenol oxidase family protein, partial [Alphaproteobacteria bacterium]|nr:polyphenol oxidase family protein [Alphaproteobacteria bacterium]
MTLPIPITHPLLDAVGVRHGFFTREGGVSAGLYKGLNTGLGSSDDPAAVRENRARVVRALGGAPDDLASGYQIHSDIALLAEAGWGDDRPEGDAVVTPTPGVICGILTADCAPVLFADPVAGVVAAAHAGWKGALGGVIQSTVDLMKTADAD